MNFYVAQWVDEDGAAVYRRTIKADDASEAAEIWASWFCPHVCEWDNPTECYVSEDDVTWVAYDVVIDSVPIYRASPVRKSEDA